MDHHDQPDHHRGLAIDMGTMTRRRALVLLGGGTLAVLAGCGSDDDPVAAGDPSTTTRGSGTSGGGDCDTIPKETAGPYPGDGSNGPNVLAEDGVVRSDIRSSFGSSSTTAEGVPLTINLVIQDGTAGCQALAGAAVYLWHCDREGRYSLYSEGVEDENYLRGVQETDASGRVTFKSIFPAAYSGRWPHIHFEVYKSLDDATGGGTRMSTSQVALPEDVCELVYATDGYEDSVGNLARTSLSTDNVFGDDSGASQLGTTSGDIDAGFTVELSVPVDPNAEATVGAGAGPGGGPGGGPPPP